MQMSPFSASQGSETECITPTVCKELFLVCHHIFFFVRLKPYWEPSKPSNTITFDLSAFQLTEAYSLPHPAPTARWQHNPAARAWTH